MAASTAWLCVGLTRLESIACSADRSARRPATAVICIRIVLRVLQRGWYFGTVLIQAAAFALADVIGPWTAMDSKILKVNRTEKFRKTWLKTFACMKIPRGTPLSAEKL